MVKYYFIPEFFEELFAELVQQFLKTNEYSCISGIYKISETIKDGNSSVVSKNILGELNYFSYNVLNENNENMLLIGYCLEADLTLFNPEYQILINQYPEIKKFNSETDYLNFIKNI